MPIPFPKIHIAESVINRIQNTLEDLSPMFPSINPAPMLPADPLALGQQIEQQTNTPAPPVSASEDSVANGAATESIFGGSPLAGAIDGMMQE